MMLHARASKTQWAFLLWPQMPVDQVNTEKPLLNNHHISVAKALQHATVGVSSVDTFTYGHLSFLKSGYQVKIWTILMWITFRNVIRSSITLLHNILLTATLYTLSSILLLLHIKVFGDQAHYTFCTCIRLSWPWEQLRNQFQLWMLLQFCLSNTITRN